MTVEWTVEDFDVGPRAGSFGVFDRPRAATLRQDAGLAVPRRPHVQGHRRAGAVRASGVPRATAASHATDDTSFTIEQVPRLTGSDRRRQFHEVTVVLLDEAAAASARARGRCSSKLDAGR